MIKTSIFGYTEDGKETIYAFPLYFSFSISSEDGILTLNEKIFYTGGIEEEEIEKGRYYVSGFLRKFSNYIAKGVPVYLNKSGKPADAIEIIRAVEDTCYKEFCRSSIVSDSCFLSRRQDRASHDIVEALLKRGFTLPEIDFNLSNDTIFDEVCTWNGLINYGPTLRGWMSALSSLPSRKSE